MNSAGGAALLVLLGLARPLPAAPAGHAECDAMRSRVLGRMVEYCVLLPPSYNARKARRYPVLYFLHGLGDNQQMFLHTGGLNLAEDLWEQSRIGEFLIVTPNADASFYINSRDGRVRYEEFFIHEFLSFIERRYRAGGSRRERGIGGISMGGYGALHLAFRHPELFEAVSAESAALMEKLPVVTVEEPGRLPVLRILGGVFGTPPDPAFWERESPLTLARRLHAPGLKIFLDCGSEDDYGFEKGAQALDKILAARGIPHKFHLFPGGHNWVYFAQHLPAALEFQSRAFGLIPGKN